MDMSFLYSYPLNPTSPQIKLDTGSLNYFNGSLPTQNLFQYNGVIYGLETAGSNTNPGLICAAPYATDQAQILNLGNTSLLSAVQTKFSGIPLVGAARLSQPDRSAKFDRFQYPRLNRKVKCDLCNVVLNSELQAKQHNGGKLHLRKLRQKERRAAKLENSSSESSSCSSSEERCSEAQDAPDQSKECTENGLEPVISDSVNQMEPVESSSALSDNEEIPERDDSQTTKLSKGVKRASSTEGSVEIKKSKLDEEVIEETNEKVDNDYAENFESQNYDLKDFDSDLSAFETEPFAWKGPEIVSSKSPNQKNALIKGERNLQFREYSPEISSSVILEEERIEVTSGECLNKHEEAKIADEKIANDNRNIYTTSNLDSELKSNNEVPCARGDEKLIADQNIRQKGDKNLSETPSVSYASSSNISKPSGFQANSQIGAKNHATNLTQQKGSNLLSYNTSFFSGNSLYKPPNQLSMAPRSAPMHQIRPVLLPQILPTQMPQLFQNYLSPQPITYGLPASTQFADGKSINLTPEGNFSPALLVDNLHTDKNNLGLSYLDQYTIGPNNFESHSANLYGINPVKSADTVSGINAGSPVDYLNPSPYTNLVQNNFNISYYTYSALSNTQAAPIGNNHTFN